ncbi:MAG: gamma-glutamylcyclotransferase [Burkholderiales bacterium]|nr:gamma-glutamylcyclotransferase [Burkholderiales bacterium]
MANCVLSKSYAAQVRPVIKRTALEQDRIRNAVRDAGHGGMLVSDEQLEYSLRSALEKRSPDQPVWVFGYGSLMWNPLMRFAERRVAKVRGYHRGFYLWSKINRGSPDKPGLVLALDRGGSCGGIAYRLHDEHLLEEFKLLWRREMLAPAYLARWVDARMESGAVKALTFVADRATSDYTGRLSDEDIIRVAVGAHGHYGSCADYLLRTAKSLEQHGIYDQRMRRLARLLMARHHQSA